MIFMKQRFRLVLTRSFVVLLTAMIAFGVVTTKSFAATQSPIINHPSGQLALTHRVESMQKNVEGKTQEAIGNVTGNINDQMMGKAKQLESQVQNAADEVKDAMTSNNRAQAIQKNLEGKAQEQIGNLTGNRKNQFQGQVKQVESNVRHVVEDIKDTARNLMD
jgi:uncharacterized protein YjbJ (UPF0337 family)